MYRRPTITDPSLTHIWVDDHTTVTACGITDESLPTHADATCLVCLDRYGAELATAFSHLRWLASPQGMTRHAFDPDAPRGDSGRVRPVCHMRSYPPDQLRPTPYVMRCPHCVRHLQHQP